MGALGAWIEGIGVLGPGLPNWAVAARVLSQASPWDATPTVLPVPKSLPSAERRRTGTLVRLTLAVGLEAVESAGVDPAGLPTVFTSSGGDGQNCHEICEVLASAERELSPTRFHNSVHNAPAGYWGIATGATAAANSLCAHDASFAAGLLEALCQVAAERTPVLLIAYDGSYPEPMRSVRPIPDAFGVALLFAPVATGRSLARLALTWGEAPADPVADPALEALRAAIPAARSLPLLAQLARGAAGRVRIDYLDGACLALEVSACR
jgi:hypothetical protein